MGRHEATLAKTMAIACLMLASLTWAQHPPAASYLLYQRGQAPAYEHQPGESLADFAHQQHQKQLDRHQQFLSQQRSMLDGTGARATVMQRQPVESNSQSGATENEPSSAAITAVDFEANNQNQNQNQNQNSNNNYQNNYMSDGSASAPYSAGLQSGLGGAGGGDCTDKLCYGLPKGCQPPQLPHNNQPGPVTLPTQGEACTVWLTAKYLHDTARPIARDILFELNAKANPEANTYAAVGFSENGRMQGFVFDCVHNRDADDQSNLVQIRHSFNLPALFTNVPATVSSGFRPIRNSIENGYYGCRWIVESAVEFNYQARNGSTQVKREDLGYKNYHILLATGEYDAPSATKLPHSDRVSSLAPVSLAQFGQLKSTTSHILVRIHGSLMVVIWAGLVTLSIVIARYYKNEWANSKLNDVALWFIIHRTLMLTAWFGSIIAVIFAYMYTETYHPGVHQLCGSTCLILSTLQVIGGVARPSLESSKRVYFNWAHFISGNLSHTFGMICLISASFLAPAHLPPAYLWVVVAFIATYAIVHIIMTIHQYIMHKSSKISITPMNDLNSNTSTSYSSGAVADSYSKGVNSPFRQFMLGIFVTLSIIFVCLLVILISNKPN